MNRVLRTIWLALARGLTMSRFQVVSAAALLAAAAFVFPLLGTGQQQAARAQLMAEVDMHGTQFTPSDITITAGTVVTFVNEEDQPGGTGAVHNVINLADGTSIVPGMLSPGDSLSVEFDDPGVISYYCSIHPTMVGSITVQ